MATDIARDALDAFDGLIAALADLERLAAHGQTVAHWTRCHHHGEAPHTALGVDMLDNITDTDTLGAPVAPPKDASAHLRLAWEGALARASSCGDALWDALAQHPTLGPILLDQHGGTNPNGMVRGPHLHVQVTARDPSTHGTLVSVGLGTLSTPPALGGPQATLDVARDALATALATGPGTARTVFAVEPNGQALSFGLALGPCIDQGGAAEALLPLMAVHKQPRWHLATQVPTPNAPRPSDAHGQATACLKRAEARGAWTPIQAALQALDRRAMALITSHGYTMQIRRAYGERTTTLWRNGKRIGATAPVQDAIADRAVPVLDAVEAWMATHAPWLASTPCLQNAQAGRFPSTLGLSWDQGKETPRAFVYRAIQMGDPMACMEEAPDGMFARHTGLRPYAVVQRDGTTAYLWSPDTPTAWRWLARLDARYLDDKMDPHPRGLAKPDPILLDLDPDGALQLGV